MCAQSRGRCGRGEPSPGADVDGVSPVGCQVDHFDAVRASNPPNFDHLRCDSEFMDMLLAALVTPHAPRVEQPQAAGDPSSTKLVD